MSKLNYIVPTRNSELVRNRIVEILTVELENQALNYNPDCETEVWGERRKPIDETETSFVNVSMVSGTFENKHQGSKDGTYQYMVDVIVKEKSTESTDGDTEAQIKMQRLMGVIDYILEDPQFKTLLFAPPFISRMWVSNVTYFEQDPKEANNIAMGRLVFNVVVNENNKLLTGVPLETVYTGIRINETEKGIQYIWL